MDSINQDELALLKAEVETLKAQMKELRTHIRFEHDDKERQQMILYASTVQCRVLKIVNDDDEPCGVFDGRGSNGAVLSLFNADQNANITLRMDEDDPVIEIYAAPGEPAVQIFEDDGHGCVAVFSPGKIPRALIKATEHGGALTAVAEDGTPRALVNSHLGQGEFTVISDETKKMITMKDSPTGGMLAVHTKEGVLAMAMALGPVNNAAFFLNDPTGREAIMMGSDGDTTMIRVAGGGMDNESGLTLMGLRSGGSISIRNEEGKNVVDLLSTECGAAVSLFSAHTDAELRLAAGDNLSSVALKNDGEFDNIRLTAMEKGSAIAVGSLEDKKENNSHALINHLGFHVVKKKIVAALSLTDSGESCVMLMNRDHSIGAEMSTYEGGGRMSVCGSDGTRQVAMSARDSGGMLGIFGDLGTERVLLSSANDGGAMSLRWGGTQGVGLAATDEGGGVLVMNSEGKVVRSMIGQGEGDDEDDE